MLIWIMINMCTYEVGGNAYAFSIHRLLALAGDSEDGKIMTLAVQLDAQS